MTFNFSIIALSKLKKDKSLALLGQNLFSFPFVFLFFFKFFPTHLLLPGTKKSPKSADFSEKYLISVGLENILQWKNRMAKNREKIMINQRFFEKGLIFTDFSGHAVHARRRRVRTNIIADLLVINSKYRRFFGIFRRFFGDFS